MTLFIWLLITIIGLLTYDSVRWQRAYNKEREKREVKAAINAAYDAFNARWSELVYVWDAKGGALYMDREQWSVVMDALIEHRAASIQRKGLNIESTSDLRANMCAELIELIHEAGK